MGEDEDHEDDTGTVDPQGQQTSGEPFVSPLGPDQCEYLSLPVVDESRGDDLKTGLGRHLRQGTVEGLLRGSGAPPGAFGGQAGPLGLGDEQLDQR